tara:strand:- start:2389 stop:3459 length:1071 start_codon:yes stop_codon:yes gene_type:complete
MPYLGAKPTDVPVGNLNNNKNLLINGSMMIAQRNGGATITDGTTYTNNDDSYVLDRWNLVSDGNNIVDVSRSTTAPDGGSPNTIALDVETDDKKFGIVQFLESADSHAAIGQTVSLQFKAKVSNARLTDVRAAVISWDGTADSVTSDVVNAWENASTVPTLATNWTYENTAASLALTTSFATYTIDGIAVDTSSTNNIAVFIWSQTETNNAGDILYITDVQLEVADVAGTYDRKSFAEEWSACQRYFFSTLGMDIAKGGNTGVANGYSVVTFGDDQGDWAVTHPLTIEMRTDPSVTIVNTYPNGSATGVFRNFNDGTTSAVTDDSKESNLRVQDTSVEAGHANDGLFGALIADAEM